MTIKSDPLTAGGSIELSSFVSLLRWRALEQPDRLAYRFLPDVEGQEVTLTNADLDRRARIIAGKLQSIGAERQRVLLLYPASLEYVAAFFGCLYSGAVAVPAYPPRPNQNLLRLDAIVQDANVSVALTNSIIRARAENPSGQLPGLKRLRWVATDSISEETTTDWREPSVDSDTLAFLQYTSGSTGTPKGVMISHGNLIHNSRLLSRAFEYSSESKCVSWLPVYHDMGLIGGILQPLFGGFECTLMSPASFLQRPLRWLQAISRYKATISGGPNFAFDLCTRRIRPEDIEGLDLTAWDTAFTGSEPVRAETLDRFSETFKPCGFRREAFYPCYGLAEATLIVSGGNKNDLPTVKSLTKGNRIRKLASAKAAGCMPLVGCGNVRDQRILIVDPESKTESAPGHVGEIWVSGPSVALGYWNRPEETQDTFRARLANSGAGPFLRTGDLGLVQDGELFLTGRIKDLIIIRGLNHYPQDIEYTVERCHPALRPGCGAAFSAEIEGEECLVVVQEIDHRLKPDLDEVIAAIRQAVAEEHELLPYAITLIKPGDLPKTSSGKIQRHACRERFLERRFHTIREWEAGEPCAVDSAASTDGAQGVEQIEQWMAAHIAARLGDQNGRVNPNQPLPRLGLDSLMAVELVHRIETVFGISLSMASLLEGESIARLAGEIVARLAEGKQGPNVIDADSQHGDEHPLSFGQRALWFLKQLTPNSTAYNVTSVVRIHGAVDVRALRRAFQAVIDRHPSLRSTFTSRSGDPVQLVHPSAEVCFVEEDVSGWDESSLHARLIREKENPFDLERGPLFRVLLLTQSSDEHVLSVAVHHIVSDFWSLALIAEELGQFYDRETSGVAVTLGEPVLRYADYVRRQSELLAGEEGERLWSYWHEQLSGDVPSVSLPLDHPRHQAQGSRGASYYHELNSTLSRALKVLGSDQGVTLYTKLLAAFQVLLYRYTHQESFFVGSPIAGRNRAELSRIVGYFVNPLVLRADFSGDPTFSEVLARLRHTVLGAFAHQEYPFPLLVERLQPDRGAGVSPLFQVMFVLQKTPSRLNDRLVPFLLGKPGARLELGSLRLESIEGVEDAAQFDLTLMIGEAGDRLMASWHYDAEIFEARTIQRMAEQFEALLESACANPDQKVSQLSILPASQRNQVLFGFNRTGRDFFSESCLKVLLEAQASRSPNACALIFGETQLSYQQLNDRANQLAHYLLESGIRPDMPVAVLMHRSLEMVIALLGVIKAGGAYVPLDPEYPIHRLRQMLEEIRPAVTLTHSSVDSRLWDEESAELLNNRVCVDEWELISSYRQDNPVTILQRDNLAYVIYTSGSTGTPKGVMNTHGGIVNRLLWMQHQYGLGVGDRVLQKTPYTFDVSVWEFFWPLITGACLVIAEPGGHRDSRYLVEEINRHQITVLHFVPSMLDVFLLEEGVESCHSIRQVFSSGEALTHTSVERFKQRLSRAELDNLYGPTEAAVDVTYWRCDQAREARVKRVPIGVPISNVEMYVLDGRLEPVPIGVTGELYIGGAGLARGYLRQADLTAERFVPDPVSRRSGERLYRTGDLGRYLPDGSIEYAGRTDDQLKVRGHRIEPAEIESVLSQHDAVRQSSVIARDSKTGEKILVAYIVAEEALPDVAEEELRLWLRQRLPEPMVPRRIVNIEAIPVSRNGKIDKRALAELELETEFEQANRQRAQGHVEELITGIWEEVLVKQVTREENFFDAGGHSLLASKVMTRLREAFRVEIELRSLFEHPSVAGLAEEITQKLRNSSGVESHAIRRISREDRIPLSFAQQRLWFLQQLEPESLFYNCHHAVRLEGALNISALERTFSEIVGRHEILRTRFIEVDGEPAQVIAGESEIRIEVTDLRDLDEREKRSRLEDLMKVEARRAFDLETGPLMRVGLVRVTESEQVLMVSVHHIVADGWSMGILVREVVELYGSYVRGEESKLEELPVQYADYAVWQREWLKGETLEHQLSYWRSQLSSPLPVLRLPFARPRPSVRTYEGACQSFVLSSELTEELKSLSRHQHATLFMTLLAAFNTLLHRYTGQTDIIIGTDLANRTHKEIEGLIGFFVNMAALRTELSDGMRFLDLLKRIREVTLGSFANQDLPFDRLVEELRPERAPGQSPVFQVVFVLENAAQRASTMEGLNLTPIQVGVETVRFDLTLLMEEDSDGRLSGSWLYSTELFDGASISKMSDRFQALLDSIVRQPDARLASLELVTEEERKEESLKDQEWQEAAVKKLLSTGRKGIDLSNGQT